MIPAAGHWVNTQDLLGEGVPLDTRSTAACKPDECELGRIGIPTSGGRKTMTPEVPVRTAFGAAPAGFYSGARFRTGCKADAFVALHATGPCKAPDGFKVARQFANRMPEGGYGNFVTDFILDLPLGRARR
jgi:hypothetical protein